MGDKDFLSAGDSKATRLVRARSVDAISMRGQLAKKDENSLSKMKDFDLKSSLETRLSRLSDVLSSPRSIGRLESDESRRNRLHLARVARCERYYSAEPEGRTRHDEEAASKTEKKEDEKVKAQKSNYTFDKLTQASSALERKGRFLLRESFRPLDDDLGQGHGRMHDILEQLRLDQRRERAADERSIGGVRSATLRAEVDSFADLINRVWLPSSSSRRVAASFDEPRRRDQRRRNDEEEDFWTRLARTKGDLNRMEMLVDVTFGRTFVSRRKFAEEDAEERQMSKRRETRVRPRSPEAVMFFTDRKVDCSSSGNSVAEMAIKWAQERRAQVELDLGRNRTTSYIDEEPRTFSKIPEDTDRYRPREPVTSINVPTIVRPASAFGRIRRTATTDLEDEDAVTTRVSKPAASKASVYRSYSTTSLGPSRRGETRSAYQDNKQTTSSDAESAEVRRRIRSVLSKYEGGRK